MKNTLYMSLTSTCGLLATPHSSGQLSLTYSTDKTEMSSKYIQFLYSFFFFKSKLQVFSVQLVGSLANIMLFKSKVTHINLKIIPIPNTMKHQKNIIKDTVMSNTVLTVKAGGGEMMNSAALQNCYKQRQRSLNHQQCSKARSLCDSSNYVQRNPRTSSSFRGKLPPKLHYLVSDSLAHFITFKLFCFYASVSYSCSTNLLCMAMTEVFLNFSHWTMQVVQH